MRLRSRKVIGLVTLGVGVLAACSPLAQAQRDLDDSRRLWAMQGVEDYRFHLQVSCFCPGEITSPVMIEVHNSAPASIIDVDTGLPNTSALLESNYSTVERLQGFIQEAIQQGADSIQASYDPDLGYPIRVRIDYMQAAIDDEISIAVTDFEVLR
jgi:hypothetical protein